MAYSQVGNKGRSNSEWQIVSPVGSGDSFKFGTFFVKIYQTPPYEIKKSLKRGDLSKFEFFHIFCPWG